MAVAAPFLLHCPSSEELLVERALPEESGGCASDGYGCGYGGGSYGYGCGLGYGPEAGFGLGLGLDGAQAGAFDRSFSQALAPAVAPYLSYFTFAPEGYVHATGIHFPHLGYTAVLPDTGGVAVHAQPPAEGTRRRPRRITADGARRLQSQLQNATQSVDIEGVFRKFDSDCSGQLSAHELRLLIRKEMRIPLNVLSDADVDSLVMALDDDGTGSLSIEELLDFVQHGPACFADGFADGNDDSAPKAAEAAARNRVLRINEDVAKRMQAQLRSATHSVNLQKLFGKYDADRSGCLSAVELKKLIRRELRIAPGVLSDLDIDALAVALDDDGGGSLSIAELVDFIERGTATFFSSETAGESLSPVASAGPGATGGAAMLRSSPSSASLSSSAKTKVASRTGSSSKKSPRPGSPTAPHGPAPLGALGGRRRTLRDRQAQKLAGDVITAAAAGHALGSGSRGAPTKAAKVANLAEERRPPAEAKGGSAAGVTEASLDEESEETAEHEEELDAGGDDGEAAVWEEEAAPRNDDGFDPAGLVFFPLGSGLIQTLRRTPRRLPAAPADVKADGGSADEPSPLLLPQLLVTVTPRGLGGGCGGARGGGRGGGRGAQPVVSPRLRGGPRLPRDGSTPLLSPRSAANLSRTSSTAELCYGPGPQGAGHAALRQDALPRGLRVARTGKSPPRTAGTCATGSAKKVEGGLVFGNPAAGSLSGLLPFL